MAVTKRKSSARKGDLPTENRAEKHPKTRQKSQSASRKENQEWNFEIEEPNSEFERPSQQQTYRSLYEHEHSRRRDIRQNDQRFENPSRSSQWDRNFEEEDFGKGQPSREDLAQRNAWNKNFDLE